MTTATEEPAAAARPGQQIDGHQLCALMGIGSATLDRHLAAGKLPTPRKVGRVNRWSLEEVVEWLRRPKPDGRLMTAAEWEPVRKQLFLARRN